MAIAIARQPETTPNRAETWILLTIAACIALLHLFTSSRYGFHRDELQFLTDACHLDRGFVGNSQGIPNEESEDHPNIFLCGPPRLPWPELWKNAINFG